MAKKQPTAKEMEGLMEMFFNELDTSFLTIPKNAIKSYKKEEEISFIPDFSNNIPGQETLNELISNLKAANNYVEEQILNTYDSDPRRGGHLNQYTNFFVNITKDILKQLQNKLPEEHKKTLTLPDLIEDKEIKLQTFISRISKNTKDTIKSLKALAKDRLGEKWSLEPYMETESEALRINEFIMDMMESTAKKSVSASKTEELAWFAYLNQIIKDPTNGKYKSQVVSILRENSIDGEFKKSEAQQAFRTVVNQYQEDIGLQQPFIGTPGSLVFPPKTQTGGEPDIVGYINNRYVFIAANKIVNNQMEGTQEVRHPLHMVISKERTIEYFKNKNPQEEEGSKGFNKRLMLEITSEKEREVGDKPLVEDIDSLLRVMNYIKKINQVKNKDAKTVYTEELNEELIQAKNLSRAISYMNYGKPTGQYEVKNSNGIYSMIVDGTDLSDRFEEILTNIKGLDRYSYQEGKEIKSKELGLENTHLTKYLNSESDSDSDGKDRMERISRSIIGSMLFSSHNLNNLGIEVISDPKNKYDGKQQSLNSGGISGFISGDLSPISVKATKESIKYVIGKRLESIKNGDEFKLNLEPESTPLSFKIEEYMIGDSQTNKNFKDAYAVNMLAEIITSWEEGKLSNTEFRKLANIYIPSVKDVNNKGLIGVYSSIESKLSIIEKSLMKTALEVAAREKLETNKTRERTKLETNKSRERTNIAEIADEFGLRGNDNYFEKSGRKWTTKEGSEVEAIRYLFEEIKPEEKESLSEYLNEEKDGAPLFCKSYLFMSKIKQAKSLKEIKELVSSNKEDEEKNKKEVGMIIISKTIEVGSSQNKLASIEKIEYLKELSEKLYFSKDEEVINKVYNYVLAAGLRKNLSEIKAEFGEHLEKIEGAKPKTKKTSASLPKRPTKGINR